MAYKYGFIIKKYTFVAIINKYKTNMPFKKGDIPNPKGRPMGTKNKVTEKMRANLMEILQGLERQVKTDLRGLEPNERVKAYTSLLAYVIPKQAAITAEAKIQTEFAELEKLLQNAPDEAVQAIATKVLEMQAEREQNENNE